MLLLVLNVVYQGKVAAQVARDFIKVKLGLQDWLKRYNKEGINGLKNQTEKRQADRDI